MLTTPLQSFSDDTKKYRNINAEGASWYTSDFATRPADKTPANGYFYPIGKEDNPKKILICEGILTGSVLYETTKLPVFCAMQADNLEAVAEAAREHYGKDVEIIVAGDKDKPRTTEEAAKAVDGKAIVPQFTPKQEAKGLTDFNDLAKEAGKLEVVKQVSAAMDKGHSKEPTVSKDTKGDFRIIGEEGNVANAKQVFVCGDEPSGVALNESTKIPVLCGNDLKAVAEAARERYGKDVEIIVAGDKDRPQIAEEAAKAVDGKAIVPNFTPRQEAKGCNTFGDLVKEAGRLEMTMQMKANLTSDREQAALDKRDRVVNRGKDDRSM